MSKGINTLGVNNVAPQAPTANAEAQKSSTALQAIASFFKGRIALIAAGAISIGSMTACAGEPPMPPKKPATHTFKGGNSAAFEKQCNTTCQTELNAASKFNDDVAGTCADICETAKDNCQSNPGERVVRGELPGYPGANAAVTCVEGVTNYVPSENLAEKIATPGTFYFPGSKSKK